MNSARGPNTDVLVAGAGIAGTSLAFELAKRGISSLVLDAAGGAPTASRMPAAVINPHRGRTAKATALDLAGARATLSLAARLEDAGHESGVHAGGVVRVAASVRQAEAWRRLSREGASLEPFGPGELGPTLNAPFGGVWVLGGGWVEPSRLLAALRQAAGGLATFSPGTRLLGYRRDGHGKSPLVCTTSAGEVVSRHLVLCLGAYDPEVARLPRLKFERGGALRARIPSRAHVPVLGAGLAPGVRAVAGPVCAVAVSADEVVVTGGHVGPDEAIDHAGLLAAAVWYLPAVADASVVETFSALRARRPSGVPVARRLAPDVYLFGGLGGRGFLVGPLLARRLATRLAST